MDRSSERLEELTGKLRELDTNELVANKAARRLELALSLANEYASLGMHRGCVKYAEVAVACDARCVEAHVLMARALRQMVGAEPQRKAVTKARRACAAGLEACSRCVAVERLSDFRATLVALDADLSALEAALLPPTPSAGKQKKKPAKRAAPNTPVSPQSGGPRRLHAEDDDRPATPSTPSGFGSPPPTTGDVRALMMRSAAGGAPGPPIAKSIWNTKDTWEERDCTNWACDVLGELLEQVADGPFNILRASDMAGHAQIVLFQGKTRFLFEFEAMVLDWQYAAAAPDAVATGKLNLRDVTNGAQDFDLDLADIAADTLAKKFLQAQKHETSPLCQKIAKAIKAFEQEFVSLSDDGAKLARSFERSKRREPINNYRPP